MNKSMQTWTDKQIAGGEQFQQQVSEQRVKLSARRRLQERISDMKKRFDVDIEAIPVDIESRGRRRQRLQEHGGV